MNDTHALISDLTPIFICVVLPITIVLIVSITKMYGDKKRSQIIIKALEVNKDVDTGKLIESLKKNQKTIRETLTTRLQCCCMFSLIGLVFVIVGIVNFASGVSATDDDVSVPLILGGIAIAIGVSYLITYLVTRKQAQNTEAK